MYVRPLCRDSFCGIVDKHNRLLRRETDRLVITVGNLSRRGGGGFYLNPYLFSNYSRSVRPLQVATAYRDRAELFWKELGGSTYYGGLL